MSSERQDVLGPDARAIVDAARLDEDPTGAEVDRLRGRVFAHLGIGIGTAAVTSIAAGSTAEAAVVTSAAASAGKAVASTSAALGATASSGGAASTATAGAGVLAKLGLGASATAAKLVAAVLVVSAGTAGVAYVAAPVEPAPNEGSAPTSTGSPASAPLAAPELRPSPVVPVVPVVPAGPAVSAEAPPAEAPPVEPTPPAPSLRASAAPRPSADADPLVEETALLARAQSALAAGRHDEALAALDEHQRKFPKGVLAQERNAARLLALCGSGRAAEARAAASAFLERQPSSPLAARLRSTCGL